jgi:hypothetical protein
MMPTATSLLDENSEEYFDGIIHWLSQQGDILAVL